MKLVCMAGLPGTGKSALARALADRVGAPVLDKDAVRRALFGARFTDYTRAQDDLCVRATFEAVRYLRERRMTRVAILDGRTYARRAAVEELLEFAASIRAQALLLECTCSEATAIARIEAGRAEHPASNRTPALYRRLAAIAEPIPPPKRVVDTERAGPEELALELARELGL